MKAKTLHLRTGDLLARGEDIGTVADFYSGGTVVKFGEELVMMTDEEMAAAGVVVVEGQR